MYSEIYRTRNNIEIEESNFELEDDVLVFDPQLNKVYVLNKTAGYILYLLRKEMGLNELIDVLCQTFKPVNDIEFDVRAILTDFKKHSLVEVRQINQ